MTSLKNTKKIVNASQHFGKYNIAMNPYFSLIKSVWKNGKPWRRSIVLYYVSFIIAQLFISLSPYTLGRAVDVLQHFTPDRLNDVIFWLAAGIVVWLLFWLFHGPARVLERMVAMKIQQRYRANIYEQLTELPLKWHQDHHSGNIISRVNRASASLFEFAGDQFIYIETIMKFIVSISFLLWLSPMVGVVSLLTCLVSVTVVILFDRKLMLLYREQGEIENHVVALLFDYIANMTTILTLRLQELTRSNLVQRMRSVWPFYRPDTVWNEMKWFCMGIVLTTMQALILIGYVVTTLHAYNAILIGTVVMIFRYQWDLSEVFFSFSDKYSQLVRMNTRVEGMRPLLEDIQKFVHVPQNLPPIQQWHNMTISNLRFHHHHSRNNILFTDLNIVINRGENIALIGASGGGKSTLLNLIRGLYHPDQVQLNVDGVEYTSLEPLESISTLIPQDPEIFETTIAFNITMDVKADESEIMRAIQLARFDKVLHTLPNGLQTDIREKGLNLSVGQKQRLALSRGLFAARYSSLILLDEPTSSVDLPTEKEILSGIMTAFPEASLIVSLHRLHLLPKFDRVIMLEQGRVLADGKASELLSKPGPVYDLWREYQEDI